MEGFVYCWTDHLTQKLYIGVHKGSIDDGYICSSKLMKEEYSKRPTDFTRQIIATGIWDDMRRLETVLLKKADVINNDSFYNLTVNTGSSHTDEVRKKISQSNKGKIFSVTHRQKLSEYRKGKETSIETKAKIALAMKNREYTDNHRNAQSKSWTPERKLNHSKRIKQLWQERSEEQRTVALAGISLNKLPEEQKKKISLSHIGKKHTKETIEKIKETKRKNKLNGS